MIELEEYWKIIILAVIKIGCVFANCSFTEFCREIEVKKRKIVGCVSMIMMFFGGMFAGMYFSRISDKDEMGLVLISTCAIISIFAGMVTSWLMMMVTPFAVVGLILYKVECSTMF